MMSVCMSYGKLLCFVLAWAYTSFTLDDSLYWGGALVSHSPCHIEFFAFSHFRFFSLCIDLPAKTYRLLLSVFLFFHRIRSPFIFSFLLTTGIQLLSLFSTYPLLCHFTQFYFYSLLTCFKLGSYLILTFRHLFLFDSQLLLFLSLTYFIAAKITIVAIGEMASFGLGEDLLERAMLVLQGAHRRVLRARHRRNRVERPPGLK